jgi:hypothetical protein
MCLGPLLLWQTVSSSSHTAKLPANLRPIFMLWSPPVCSLCRVGSQDICPSFLCRPSTCTPPQCLLVPGLAWKCSWARSSSGRSWTAWTPLPATTPGLRQSRALGCSREAGVRHSAGTRARHSRRARASRSGAAGLERGQSGGRCAGSRAALPSDLVLLFCGSEIPAHWKSARTRAFQAVLTPWPKPAWSIRPLASAVQVLLLSSVVSLCAYSMGRLDVSFLSCFARLTWCAAVAVQTWWSVVLGKTVSELPCE